MIVDNYHIFFLSFEDIARITKKIHQYIESDFYASIGTIFIRPYTYPCIRIKYLPSFTLLPELQELLSQQGVKFLKYKQIEKKALIVVNKNFLLKEQKPGIYRDLENDSKSYIELPEQLDWEIFRKFTFHIKNNIIENNFDAALGVLYRMRGIVDVVRVYDGDNTLKKMRALKAFYEEQIRKSHK